MLHRVLETSATFPTLHLFIQVVCTYVCRYFSLAT
jgi:hypothetical protein